MASVHPDQLQPWDAHDTGRLYRLIADTIPQLVWATAPDGDADYFNSRLLDYTGVSADQLAGQRWREIIHPDDREHVFVAWSAAARTGERYTSECRLRRADGAYRWHHVSALPLRAADGRVLHWFGTCTDIEDQVRSARLLESTVEQRTRALRESEARFRSLVALSSDWYWEQDDALRFTRFEGRVAEISGSNPKGAIGKRRWELESIRPLCGAWEEHRAQLEAHQPFRDFEYSRVGDDGVTRFISVSGEPVHDAGGRFVGYRGLATDITPRKRAEQAVRESEARFRSLTELSSDWYWEQDAEFRFTVLSGPGASANASGGDPSIYLGKARWEIADLAPLGGDWTSHRAQLERHESFRDLPLRRRMNDGTVRYMSVSGEPVLGSDGRFAGYRGVAKDITTRIEADQALRESEQRFQLFMDNLPACAWIRDAQFRFTYVNRRYAKTWGGLEPETLLGRDAGELYPPEVAAYFRDTDDKVREQGAPIQFVDSLPSGQWLKVKFPLPDGKGGAGVAGVALDISEQSRLEKALRESEKRFRAFMDHAPAVAWIKDARFRYTYVNRAFERYHDRRAQDLLGRDDFELFPADVARYFRTDDEEMLKGREATQKLRQYPYADGNLAHWLVVKFPFADASGATGLAGIAIDVTPRVEAEEKARRYAQDVRDLVNRLVQAQEAERRRVAGELHDLIGQNLTALGIDLQALKQRLQSAGDLIAGPRLDAMAALVETTIDAIRGVMTDLRPAALEEFGLVPALRWYASVFSKRTGMKVSTHAEGRELRLPGDSELALFRIVQEALTNAAKHSGGTSVEIAIRYGEGLQLTVEDDGRGFAEPAGARSARRGGFGLPTMRERAEAHGGTLRVEFPERGTRLVVDMPAQGDGD